MSSSQKEVGEYFS